jgi:hypothetical protein
MERDFFCLIRPMFAGFLRIILNGFAGNQVKIFKGDIN